MWCSFMFRDECWMLFMFGAYRVYVLRIDVRCILYYIIHYYYYILYIILLYIIHIHILYIILLLYIIIYYYYIYTILSLSFCSSSSLPFPPLPIFCSIPIFSSSLLPSSSFLLYLLFQSAHSFYTCRYLHILIYIFFRSIFCSSS